MRLRGTAMESQPVALVLVLVAGIGAIATPPQGPEPVICVPAAPDDPAPWIWNSRILGTFPSDTPKPEFAGAFRSSDSAHELHLWRDSKGVFGELLSPVLNADSPTSRLYDPHFNPRTGAVNFTVRFKDGERRFTGTLRPDLVTGTLQDAARSETVRWRKLPVNRVHGAANNLYTSRAQFECAMILFRRY